MVWAQWGLKEKFLGNPDVWLCQQCNDCTAYCPRGAKPAEVLGAIRKQSIQQYSTPGFLACLVNSKKFMPILFLLPAILLVLVAKGFSFTDDVVVFTNMFPVFTIQLVFMPALAFGVIIGFMGVMKFWKDMKQAQGVSSGNLVGSIISTTTEFLGHSKFKDCDVSKDRFLSHFLVFYSFVALAIATGFGVIYIDILHKPSPFAFGYGTPVKLFGVIGALGLFLGALLMIINRFKNAGKVGLGSYFDWLLITIVSVIMASGILSYLTRIANIQGIAYPVYFIHLVFVFSLFVYLPYSKLAHMFYRGTALVFNKYSGRETQAQAPKAQAEQTAAPDTKEEAEPKQEAETGQQQ
jgi:quinone-modifying oxidoreductase subunit QmoC